MTFAQMIAPFTRNGAFTIPLSWPDMPASLSAVA